MCCLQCVGLYKCNQHGKILPSTRRATYYIRTTGWWLPHHIFSTTSPYSLPNTRNTTPHHRYTTPPSPPCLWGRNSPFFLHNVRQAIHPTYTFIWCASCHIADFRGTLYMPTHMAHTAYQLYATCHTPPAVLACWIYVVCSRLSDKQLTGQEDGLHCLIHLQPSQRLLFSGRINMPRPPHHGVDRLWDRLPAHCLLSLHHQAETLFWPSYSLAKYIQCPTFPRCAERRDLPRVLPSIVTRDNTILPG